MKKKEVKLADVISVLINWRWRIIINFFIVAIGSAIYSLTIPKQYQGQAVILPPTSGGGTSMASFAAGGLGDMLTGMNFISTESGIYWAILNSRSLRQAVIDSFNLAEVYEFKNKYFIENVLRKLDNKVAINLDEELGLIYVRVSDKSPQRAADMANFFVRELGRISKEIAVEKARRDRIFLKKRVNINYSDIAKAELAMREFSEKYNAVAIPEQLKAAISTAADIKAQLMSQQVQYQVYKKSLELDHPKIKEMQERIAGLEMKLSGFNSASSEFGDGRGLFPGFAQLPHLQQKYAELYREVEVQNKLLDFLLPQYEAAKIKEARDSPNVQVLDHAIPPERKSAPKRSKIVIISSFFSLVITLMYTFIYEHFRKIRTENTDEYKTWQSVFSVVRKDFSRIPILNLLVKRDR